MPRPGDHAAAGPSDPATGGSAADAKRGSHTTPGGDRDELDRPHASTARGRRAPHPRPAAAPLVDRRGRLAAGPRPARRDGADPVHHGRARHERTRRRPARRDRARRKPRSHARRARAPVHDEHARRTPHVGHADAPAPSFPDRRRHERPGAPGDRAGKQPRPWTFRRSRSRAPSGDFRRSGASSTHRNATPGRSPARTVAAARASTSRRAAAHASPAPEARTAAGPAPAASPAAGVGSAPLPPVGA